MAGPDSSRWRYARRYGKRLSTRSA